MGKDRQSRGQIRAASSVSGPQRTRTGSSAPGRGTVRHTKKGVSTRAQVRPQNQKPDGESSAATRATRQTAASAPRFSPSPTPSGSDIPIARRGMAKVKGTTLRTKLMLAMAGMTAFTMIVLGLTLTMVTNSFLTGQAQHKGVEVAKMAAALGRVVLDNRQHYGNDGESLRAAVDRYFRTAVTWGETEGRYSDILGITFAGTELSGAGYGPEITGSSSGIAHPRIRMPRLGWVSLPQDIVVGETEREGQPVYRFKVSIPAREAGYIATGFVWVDLAADKVHGVRNNLFIIVGVAVVLSLTIVMGIAIWLAGSITRPVQILLRDMDVVAKGNLDHQTRSHSRDEVGLLATSFNRMTKDLKAAQSALVEQEKAEYELSLAREVQQQLLPAQAPEIPGYEPFAYYKGAKAVSGDYYDFIPLGDGVWGFIIADVSGKGIPGSMVMAVTRTIIRLIADQHKSHAAGTLMSTNRLIAKQIKRGMFVTAFYAVLDTKTGAVVFSSAGHNPMLIYRAASRKVELAAPKGIAIGFNEGPLFDKNIQEFQTIIHPGDSMVLFTDGFPEAMNERNEEFGDGRFYQLLAAHGHLGAQEMIDGVVDAIAQHRGRAPQSDDLTMLTVRRLH